MSRSRCSAIAITASLLALPVVSWAKPRTTAEVLQNHLEAFCPGGMDDPADVDRIMEDYHVNALNITGDNLGAPPATSAGRESIRAGFEGLFAAVTNGCDLVLTQQVVNGQYGFLQWVWPELGGLAPGLDAWGTDTFLVKGGQIQLQTVFISLLRNLSGCERPARRVPVAPGMVDTTPSLAMLPAERPRTGAGSSLVCP